MEDTQLEKLRYPIGKFQDPTSYSSKEISHWINEIEEIPALIRKEINLFTEEMLDESYRPQGWTARQVVNHIVDRPCSSYSINLRCDCLMRRTKEYYYTTI